MLKGRKLEVVGHGWHEGRQNEVSVETGLDVSGDAEKKRLGLREG